MRLLVIIFLSFYCAPTGSIAPEPTFGIEETITFAKVVDFDQNWPYERDFSRFSQDRKYFVTLVRQGDLQSNANVDTLYVYRSVDIQGYLDNGFDSPPPSYRTLNISSTDNEPAIQRVRWIDSSTVGFIAPGDNGIRQATIVDIHTGNLAHLTEHDTDVVNFDYKNEVVIFFAKASLLANNDVQRMGVGVSVEHRTLYEIVCSDYRKPSAVGIIEIFVKTPTTRGVKRIDDSRGRMFYSLANVWLSPNAKYAIFLFPPANAPPHWSEYATVSRKLVGIKPGVGDPTSWDLYDYTRYMLLDVSALAMEPLFDAPTGQQLNWNAHAQKVFWNADSTFAIVTNTYLPLEGVTYAERQIRTQSTAIAEVEIPSRNVRRILTEPMQSWDQLKSGAPRLTIGDVSFDIRTQLLAVRRQTNFGSLGEPEFYRRRDGAWGLADDIALHSTNTPHFRVINKEDMNTPPHLAVVRNHDDRERLLLDANPNVKGTEFGGMEEIRWKDDNGIEWNNVGLLYPPSYESGRRYPLIVQTHGFDRNEFLLDGAEGATAPFAARTLSSYGFLVLQVDEPAGVITADEREGRLVATGLKAGVNMLVTRGVVDAERVGVIGWSRTGYHVLHAIVREPELFAAVTIADGVQYGYLEYITMTNLRQSSNAVTMNGGALPVGNGMNDWTRNAPTFNLDRNNAPVRLESYGSLITLLGIWETYAILTRLEKPVDLIYLPRASHAPFKVRERLLSQKGNVQWFLFWLQGIEAPDPVFENQYSRWRAMRAAVQQAEGG